MTALTEDKQMQYTEGVEVPFDVYRSTTIYAGSLVCVRADGYAIPGDDATGLLFMGVAVERVNNSSGNDGDKSVVLRRRGLIKATFANTITIANVGDSAYIVDDQTLDLVGQTTHDIFAGIIAGFIDSTHAWVDIEPAVRQSDAAAHIADGTAAHAASAISVLDSGDFTSEEEVESALEEIYQHLISVQKFIPIPLTCWMLSDGSNTVTFGGPATDPILDMANGDTDSALRWAWAATSVVAIIVQVPLPPDMDVTKDLVLHLLTKKDADANTVTLASDTYFMDGDTKVEDVTETIAQAFGETTITIAATDIPAGAQTVTIELTPSAHAGDALYMQGSWLEYTAKLLTA
jgi:hypothetical protein